MKQIDLKVNWDRTTPRGGPDLDCLRPRLMEAWCERIRRLAPLGFDDAVPGLVVTSNLCTDTVKGIVTWNCT